MKKKTLTLLLALALVLGVAAGSTLAWLTDKTEKVENTFTTSGVDIELTETTGDSYKMIPGHTITKDPKVTVVEGSEKCYVFVKVEKSANFDTYMTYDMADGWTALEGQPEVFYRVVEDTAAVRAFAVIKDNTVSVKPEVTKEMMNELTEPTYPTLKVTAYACQYYKSNTAIADDANGTPFAPTEAWTNCQPTTTP